MNKRAKKKAEKLTRAKIHKTLDYVLDINGLKERKQEITGHLPTAFFSFDGHVAGVGYVVYKTGWSRDAVKTYSGSGFTDSLYCTIDGVNRELEIIKEELCTTKA